MKNDEAFEAMVETVGDDDERNNLRQVGEDVSLCQTRAASTVAMTCCESLPSLDF